MFISIYTMDSFYDVPRRAPVPTRIEGINIRPLVPEVSLISPPESNTGNCINERLWSNSYARLEGSYTNCNKDNTLKEIQINCSSTNIRKSLPYPTEFGRKQVRFQSPILQQRPSLTYEPFETRRIDPQNQNLPVQNEILKNCNNTPLKQSFQQIYMANIPNRHLDLSIIDLPKHTPTEEVKGSEIELLKENNENMLPKTYKEFLETQHNILKHQDKEELVTDIFNYKRNVPENSQFSNSIKNGEHHFQFDHSKLKSSFHQCSQEPMQKSDCVFKPDNIKRYQNAYNLYGNTNKVFYNTDQNTLKLQNDHPSETSITRNSNEVTINKQDYYEPTNRDLLKIIAQQNEQLLLLQKQVALLLNREHQNKSIESVPSVTENIVKDRKEIDCEPHRFDQDINLTPRKHGLSKFSVDVMTSFEVAIRPQHNRQGPMLFNNPKIEEISEEISSLNCISDKKEIDQSLHLQEPVKLVEPCPSPEPSININMNDYDSSDDEVSASEISTIFYQNLMGQVNNILKQAQIQTREDLCANEVDSKKKITCSVTNKTMHRVREATLKHLKNIGVTIGQLDEYENECASLENNKKEYSPTEISYGVKQLLMKYLPDEHLVQISNKQKIKTDQINREFDTEKTKPEFSFASLQYMKKYNLLPSSGRVPKVKDNFFKPLPSENNHRILDLTALKLQPKLL